MTYLGLDWIAYSIICLVAGQMAGMGLAAFFFHRDDPVFRLYRNRLYVILPVAVVVVIVGNMITVVLT